MVPISYLFPFCHQPPVVAEAAVAVMVLMPGKRMKVKVVVMAAVTVETVTQA